jgi:hypothetical protein
MSVPNAEDFDRLADGPWTMTRRSHLVRWILAIVAGALVASTLGYLIDDQVSERDHFNRAHTSLVKTRRRSDDVAHDLTALRHDVAVLMGQVASASTSWTQDTSQLKAAEYELALVQSDVTQGSTRIGSLHTCLAGVQQALNALAINNQAVAVSDLNAVSSSCSESAGG